MSERQIKYIYWFAYYNLDSPSVRYRAQYPLEFAHEKLGIPNRLIIPGYSPKTLFNFIQGYLSALFFLKKDSLIVIQRVHSNFIYSNLLKLLVKVRRKQTVYDLDDADYIDYNPKAIHYFARKCNFVSAGSAEIANYLSQYNQNVIHITSPTPDLGIIKQERNKIFTIGWVGGFGWGHKDSLFEYLFPAIKNLPFKCQLILIGLTKDSDENEIRTFFKDHSNVEIIIPRGLDWRDEKDLQIRIAQFDIGIATLLDNPIQLAKSGIKAKQYMNNGVPVLCNNLPENNKVVLNGYNGFICNSSADFENKLVEFKEMTDEKFWEFSRNARNSIENFDHYNYFNDFEKIKNGVKKK